jgi:hypothetical protein
VKATPEQIARVKQLSDTGRSVSNRDHEAIAAVLAELAELRAGETASLNIVAEAARQVEASDRLYREQNAELTELRELRDAVVEERNVCKAEKVVR